jgi:hypothetical protein
MKLVIIFLILSFSVFAHEECGELNHPELEDIANLNKVIDWHAASDDDIKKAFCTQKTAPTAAEMTKWLIDHQSPANVSKKINGIAFEGESIENLEAFRLLTTYVDILGNVDPAKHKDFTSTCKKVECAVKQLLGNDIGLQLLYMQRRYGMNGSHIIKEKNRVSPWKKEELDDVLLSLSDFPEGVLPFQEARDMVHAPRGQGSGNTLANAIVTIFDLWNTETAPQRRATVTHELGHAISGVTKTGGADQWKKLSGWSTKSTIVNGKTISVPTPANPGAIVSEYGLTNEEEDLAEAVVAYRYNPKLLKTASPDKYNMLKATIFDNVEYTSEAACKSPKRTSSALKTKIAAKVQTRTPTEAELKQIGNRCSERATEDLISQGYMNLGDNYFKSCYANSVKAQTVEFLKKELKGMPYEKHLEPMIRNAFSEIDPAKLSEIARKAETQHRTAFRNTISTAIKDGTYCSPEMAKYGSHAFEDEVLGFTSYYYKDGLNAVMAKACAAKSNKSFQVNQLIR